MKTGSCLEHTYKRQCRRPLAKYLYILDSKSGIRIVFEDRSTCKCEERRLQRHVSSFAPFLRSSQHLWPMLFHTVTPCSFVRLTRGKPKPADLMSYPGDTMVDEDGLFPQEIFCAKAPDL